MRYCGRDFRKLFDAVDDLLYGGEKYSEVDTKKLKTEDINEIVDLCFQCKRCYIKCPYTPRNRLSQVDGAGKGQAGKGQGRTVGGQGAGSSRRRRKVGYCDVAACQLGQPKWPYIAQFMQSLLGIHKDKKLPPFASKTFASQFAAHRKTPQGEPAAKIAFFSTCYVNFAHLVEQFLG